MTVPNYQNGRESSEVKSLPASRDGRMSALDVSLGSPIASCQRFDNEIGKKVIFHLHIVIRWPYAFHIFAA